MFLIDYRRENQYTKMKLYIERKNLRKIITVITCVLLLGSILCSSEPLMSNPVEIHIAPSMKGDDSNPGTKALPVATMQKARNLVRELIRKGLTAPVAVILAEGTYQIEDALELTPEDSGSVNYPITWRAATGAKVILNGGRTITSKWIKGDDGIWYTDLKGVGLGKNEWNFRQLFVNGRRAIRARFPNADQSNPFLYATGGELDHLVIAPHLIKESWGTAEDAQINVVPESRFFNQWNTVSAVDKQTGRIDLTESERHRTINKGSWFWIEGVREELDSAEEWFLDTKAGRLYYMPELGTDPNTLTIMAAHLDRIITLKGDVEKGTHVRHIHFNSLNFQFTEFTLGHIEARVHTDAVIMFENTENCSVKNSTFENIGGYALWMHLDCKRNSFDNNTVRQSGGGGVLMTGARLGYMDDSKILTPGVAASKVAPILNSVTRNTVEHCGKIRYYGGGVHMDSRPFSMSLAPGNYVGHNYFNDLSRNGVFAFRNQGGSVVEYNHIHNALQTTIDGAAIHFATMNTINAPNFILNNWLYDIWGYEQKPSGKPVRTLANGIFLDWDTSTTTVRDNYCYNSPVKETVKKVFKDHQNLVVSNNPYSETPITPDFVLEIGPQGTASKGIVLSENKLTGSIIHYTDTANVTTKGVWKPELENYNNKLFEFNFLAGSSATVSEASFNLPVTEDGSYTLYLLYKPGEGRASNVPITIAHADGVSKIVWNMQKGMRHGFAKKIGTYRFLKGKTNTVTISTEGVDGKVIADSVAFVKMR